jgi:tetratricopeptide (TPR) repeat protein
MNFPFSSVWQCLLSFLFRYSGRLAKSELTLNDQRTWLAYSLTLLFIPLFIVLLYALKYEMCSFSTGLQWFMLLPVVTTIYTVGSVFFGLSFRTSTFKKVLIALAPTLFFSLLTIRDLYIDPSLSFFHPVIGYFPGPMYDEWIPMFPSLYTYRLWIIALSLFLWGFTKLEKNKWPIFLLVLLPLFLRNQLNWHYSHQSIQKILRSSLQSKYTSVFFEGLDVVGTDAFGESMDFYIEHISKKLSLPLPTKKIKIYVYRGAYQKKKLTGTAETLVGNPIQGALHILPTEVSDTILVHELTHVIAAPMGIPILKLSPSISLLEGLATAMQPSHLDISIHEWAKAMMDLNKLPDIEQSLGAITFWKQNPVRVYFASGSFSKWLIDTYGIESFKKVYAWKNFEKTYQMSIQNLILEWKNFISTIKVSQANLDMADYFFNQKPFHEKQCVHEVAEQEMKFAICNKKTTDCNEFINRACELDPKNPALLLKRARYLYKQTLKPLDTAMIPLPSASGTRVQNNIMQLFHDDLHRSQNPQEVYNLSKYDHPSPALINTILTRMFLARNSKEVLEAIILGDYVPDTDLTWNTNDSNYNHAMLYFSKLAIKEKQAHKAIVFLDKIDLKNETDEFKLSYREIQAQALENLTSYSEAIEAYNKVSILSQSLGEKEFAEFQIQRLMYLLAN